MTGFFMIPLLDADAKSFFEARVRKAKKFGFPEPIYINAAQLSSRSRVVYLVEVQAIHILNEKTQKTHHYALKFSKFNKIKAEPFWEEESIVSRGGFTIADRASIEKLAAYIKANQALLGIDILSKDYTSAILSNDVVVLNIVKKILESEENKNAVYELLREQYPAIDKKILIHKLVRARSESLAEFKKSMGDESKKERDYWHPFLKQNRWMFGLSFVVLLDESRIDLLNTADYLSESEDGFIDVVEIKHPHFNFWQKDRAGVYKRYRKFLQPDEELKGAITQGTNYIFQVEKKFSDPDWQRSNNCATPVKPNCTIIFGRSNTWAMEEKTAFRLLNDSLHGISIITFDHLFDRASRLLESLEEEA